MQTLRQTIRTLRRDAGFSAIAIAMLALGIGSTTAIFSVVNVVLLQSSYQDAERLYVLEQVAPDLADRYPSGEIPINGRHFDHWRRACTVCESLGLITSGGANLTGDGDPERIRTFDVSHDLLPTLGIAPVLGRPILPSDDEPEAQQVILLTDGFWRRRYAAEPNVVGREISLDDVPVTVIGVLPADFEPIGGAYLREFGFFAEDYAGLRPLRLSFEAIRPVGSFNFGGVVRLKPGATPEQATDQMDASILSFVEEYDREMGVRLRPLNEAVVGQAATGLWMLMAAVGAVLLIVCVNVGNLMFIRVERRGREAAVRRALGATSRQLLADVLREGFVLALAGGAVGVLVAQWAIGGLVAAAPTATPRLGDVRMDYTALAFARAATTLAALLTSLLPAFRYRSIRGTFAETQATGTASSSKVRSRGVSVALETGLSAALLIAATLMVSSLFRLLSVEKGFVSENVLAFDLVLPSRNYPEEGGMRSRFLDQLIERLSAQPGVQKVGFSTRLPLEGATYVDSMRRAGSNTPADERVVANYRFVSEGYWQTMGIPLLEGRFLELSDRGQARVVISEEAARRLFPGESAVGKSITAYDDDDPPFEVVGVAADVKTGGLQESAVPIGYVSYWTKQQNGVSFSVRTTQDATAFAGVVREAVWSLDPTLPVTNVRTMDEMVAKAAAEQRFQTTLAGLFSLTALGLAALGIYGVVSYAAAQRTKEIGLRMAVGAEGRRIAAMVLGQGMKPIVVGLAAGLAAAALAARWMESLVFEVSVRDPGVFIGAAAVLLFVSLLACYLPARRAARVDPMTALRHE